MPESTEALLAQEQTIQAELERRAADQDAAIEAALLAGTLPEEDRRLSVGEQYIADTMAALPAGASFSWADGLFRVRRGPNAVGEGTTLARAIRVIGATYINGENGQRILVDEAGEPIPAE